MQLTANGLRMAAKSESGKQASPSALDHHQNTDGNNILSPGVACLVDLGGMVEKFMATKDLFPCFWIDAIIDSNLS